MPVLEYRCRKCRQVTSFAEKPNTSQSHTCEKGGSKDTEKIFSTFAAKVGNVVLLQLKLPDGNLPAFMT